MNVYSNFTHNCWKLEVTQMSFNWSVDNTPAHWHNGLLLSSRKEVSCWRTTTWMNLTCILLSERSQIPKSYLLYDSFHMTFWKMQNYRAKKRPVVVRGCWVGKQFSIKEWHGEFWGVKELLCMQLWEWTHNFMHLLKPTKLYTTKWILLYVIKT